MSIQYLLGAPNPDDPLDPEIGRKWREHEELAIKTAVAWTRLYATPTAPTPAEDSTTQFEENTAEIDEPSPGLSAGASSKTMAVSQIRLAGCHDIFRYGSLGRADETRILRLYPGLPSDPLVGIIQHITLPSYMHGDSDSEFLDGPETPAYEALSYAWGQPEATEGIYLHAPSSDPENARMLGLAENCALALRRLRHPNKERSLWVDAICINQADVAERGAQVRIMHRIYKTASRVLIYLGEGSAATDQAIAILQDDADGRRQCITDSPEEEISLQTFFSLPWFKRVWVLQEVAWAATALAFCGSQVVSWETLQNAYTSSIGRIDRLQPLPHVLSFGEPRPDGEMTTHELFMELKKARVCDASDPRDKVYALLELFHKRHDDPRLAIDYERKVSNLYTDVSLYLMRCGEGLGNVLAETHDEPSRVPGLVIPSWVINWAAPPRPTYRFDGCFAGGRYGGCYDKEFPSSSVPEATPRSRGNTGPARHRHPPDEIPRGDAPRRNLRVHYAAYLHAVGTSGTTFAFPRSSSTGQAGSLGVQDWDSPENVPAFEQLMEHIQKVESSTTNSDQFDINSPAPPDMADFRSRWSPETKRTKQMLAKLRNRKVFTTENGLPAIGPLHTQGGDRIFAFQHTNMCHVLRPTSQTDVYTYVGDCFLYGHMQLWWNAIQGCGLALRHDVGDGPDEEVPWEEVVIY